MGYVEKIKFELTILEKDESKFQSYINICNDNDVDERYHVNIRDQYLNTTTNVYTIICYSSYEMFMHFQCDTPISDIIKSIYIIEQ